MEIVLFDDKKKCCGCGACMNVCPKNAISMQEDEYGFIYPQINQEICVECGACKKVCGYQNLPEKHKVKKVYAAASKDDDLLKKSASGGAFAVIARKILEDGGVVYGVALPLIEGKLIPKHIRIDTTKELIQLQGSKYVQSEIGYTYQQAKQDLQQGKLVLFSGTPCQIAGLKAYLKKEYENLISVEVICHGVPNARFFNDYITYTEQVRKSPKTKAFLFRDKSKGQGKTSKFIYEDDSSWIVNGKTTSYVSFFMKSLTQRINCYSCPYATPDRVADITLGDFWGFHEEYPNRRVNCLSNSKGISCVLANTERGVSVLQKCETEFILMESTFEKVARHNTQLNEPSRYSKDRENILALYIGDGYKGVEKYYLREFWKEKIFYQIMSLIPKAVKRTIKRVVAKIRK